MCDQFDVFNQESFAGLLPQLLLKVSKEVLQNVSMMCI